MLYKFREAKTMFIPDKKKFMEEVSKVQSEKAREQLVDLYEHLLGTKILINANKVVKEVLTEMFQINQFSKEVLIPLNFHDTLIAKVLFPIMYGQEEKLYTIADIIEMSKAFRPKPFTKEWLSQEIKEGNLKGTFKSKRYHFTQSQVSDYFELRGYKFDK
jgi:hypothetical protein